MTLLSYAADFYMILKINKPNVMVFTRDITEDKHKLYLHDCKFVAILQKRTTY